MRKVYVVQQPRFNDSFDLTALKALGEVEYLLPSAPNIHDQERITADLRHMVATISNASPSDIFVTLGGSPISQMLFGSAFVIAGRRSINYGLFSRGRDDDGRRDGAGGTYRLIPVDLGLDEQNIPPAPLAATGA